MAGHGRHRREARRGLPTGRMAVSAAAVGLGALQLGGVATAAPAGGGGGVGGTSCTDDRIKACVDLSENRAWLLDGEGHVVDGPVHNSHGADGSETPTGDFVVQWKDRDHKSSEHDGASMPYSVFFDTHGRAFHAGSTDRDSAGCVRLELEDAKRFFEYLEPNDRVQIVP